MPASCTVCIALGSNMGDRASHMAAARGALSKLPKTKLLAFSQTLETQPVGPIDQQAFFNAAAMISTELLPRELLDELNLIEAQRGRDRFKTRIKWGPRPLDLDIIFYQQQVISEDDLTIPHPLMHQRWFVLKPLCEIAPDWVHPILEQTVTQLLAKVKP
ncbi:MAG: 2-amino-4-hydroxy-6-hydroxymethyldihydropteridine diphosphokinase [Phycisphaeraceae bacterium]|nr:2-amino-4-hydroxy-6-hydroxymethyldihydropteridine diphosphokinase [Phycisphaeraceae bacterium]